MMATDKSSSATHNASYASGQREENFHDIIVSPEARQVAVEALEECQEVDMSDPMMDPLEWTVRKVIPIPKEYYWNTGVAKEDVPTKTRLWHQTIHALSKVTNATDSMGESISSGLGLSTRRYDYIVSTMTEQERGMLQEPKTKEPAATAPPSTESMQGRDEETGTCA
mmetsp:Transcript_14576/g.22197  ORF Transcript_14576/g.22197 Transcript_14576/m.22197 type:complete len:168 (+) Transcript_14576:84-587(+)